VFGRMVLDYTSSIIVGLMEQLHVTSSSRARFVDRSNGPWEEQPTDCVYKASPIPDDVLLQPVQHLALQLKIAPFTLDQSHLPQNERFLPPCFYLRKSWHNPAFLSQKSSR
jgi:hypothetical protein